VPAISGDAERLQQVMWNLLSNAVKYTPRGGKISVRLERINDVVRITVRDTGMGISSQFLPHVFERFKQADMSSTRVYSGLGVGLAIVRYLVELHGGVVSAASEGNGQGAVFVVTLPITTGSARWAIEKPAAAVVSERGNTAPIRVDAIKVLVVEDDLDTRELLMHVLSQYGAKVIAVDSVLAAIQSLEQHKPDVLVADLSMPGEDGFALIKKIRLRTDELKDIPAIAVTSFVRPEDRSRALAAGYQFHIQKPLDVEILLRAIASTVRSPH
jgi:CheY-like chemotaxis protein/anti-sigma regulatory factor (Ser/Thr protein kinase)